MKFDLVIGNPPYNESKGGQSGTGGATSIYKQFYKKVLDHLIEDGKLCFVCPKGIIRNLYDTSNQVDVIDLMTDKRYWEFSTLFFILTQRQKHTETIFRGHIIEKIWSRSFNEWGFKEYSRSKKTHTLVEALLSLPKIITGNQIKTGYTDSALAPAHRVFCEKLANKNFMAWSEYADLPRTCGYVDLDSRENADRLVLFLRNNKLVSFFAKKTNLSKSREKDFFRFTKKFDLSQIKTGFEYPVEYGLTQEEIDEIENQAK